MRSIRRFIATAGATGMVVTGAALVPSPAMAASCPTGWGSLPKTSDTTSTATVTGVSATRMRCYDRVVIRLNGTPGGYDVRYVDGFNFEAEGHDVPARGGAKLEVIVNSPAYDGAGRATYTPKRPNELVSTKKARTLRQGVWLGSYEGETAIGLGVRARLPYRVTVVDDPGPRSRVIVDIAHTW